MRSIPPDSGRATLTFDVVDVFAEQPFAGNQLAVVHGAEGLSADRLLAVAREFNFSETTFPVPLGPDGYHVRIFTPGGEIPFAGHPTLGTAWVLREHGELAGDATQHCGAGEIAVRFDEGRVELTAVRRDLAPVPVELTGPMLAGLGLDPSALAGPGWAAGTGLTFVHLPVVPDAVSAARPRGLSLDGVDLRNRDPLGGVNLHAVLAADRVHARVFVPDLSVPEDPATGSAAAGLGVVLRQRGALAADGRFVINQGAELGRPSTLYVCAPPDTDEVRVAGAVVPIASGRIRVP